ncbi:hypothetical protein Pmar_PMAR012696 [Perkinsus marinus ATCC 50983]|uniref:EF-hand domain-containing protein n=1 Tax=Perkinsus marinus (strain ATCC 50983 / TXsc) TaxID=423536 RepID=C5K823_PERM5|nr:hypothetical protein Pmar_PMAR012696 [Perkinsus marinus ATCC 50983]EER19708.1 hypothetical protein Pmar_PMAR012696 [Perkinsus marinus ATCC 50983]|eukprot:XP_002787912.1 hypothetical protein Pmar_PMAR012696 [Perkinsus marinus ATCC 50983]
MVTRKTRGKQLASGDTGPTMKHQRPFTAPGVSSSTRAISPCRSSRIDLAYIPPRSGMSPLKRKHILLSRINDISGLCRTSGLKGLPDTITAEAYARNFLDLPVNSINPRRDCDDDDDSVVISAIMEWLDEPLGSLWHFHIELGEKPGSASSIFFVHDGLKYVTNLHPDHLPMMRLIEFYVHVSQRLQRSSREGAPRAVLTRKALNTNPTPVMALLEKSVRRVRIRARKFIAQLKRCGGVSAFETWPNWANFNVGGPLDEGHLKRMSSEAIALIEAETRIPEIRCVKACMMLMMKWLNVSFRENPDSPAASNDPPYHARFSVEPGVSPHEENWSILGAKGWYYPTYRPVMPSTSSESGITPVVEKKRERLANEKRQCLKVSRRWSIDPTVARIISISFTSVVADGSKTIGKERYHAMCKRCVLESATNPNIVDSLAPEWFHVIDADHDGRVCLDDILRWYTKLTLHQSDLMETVKEDEIEGDGRALPKVGASYFERQASVHSESTEPSPQKGEAQNAATTPSDGEGVAGLARLNTQMSVRIDAAEGDSEGEGVVVASNMEVTEGDRTSEQAVDSPSVARDEDLLRDNFSTVAMLLDEMIDGPGLPFSTHKATLEAMLPPPTMLGKFIAAVAGTSAKMATDRQQAVALPSANLSLGVRKFPYFTGL